jgi:molecular chaperone HtpG
MLKRKKIKNLIKKYSEFINYPIKLYVSKHVSEEVYDNKEKKVTKQKLQKQKLK